MVKWIQHSASKLGAGQIWKIIISETLTKNSNNCIQSQSKSIDYGAKFKWENFLSPKSWISKIVHLVPILSFIYIFCLTRYSNKISWLIWLYLYMDYKMICLLFYFQPAILFHPACGKIFQGIWGTQHTSFCCFTLLVNTDTGFQFLITAYDTLMVKNQQRWEEIKILIIISVKPTYETRMAGLLDTKDIGNFTVVV